MPILLISNDRPLIRRRRERLANAVTDAITDLCDVDPSKVQVFFAPYPSATLIAVHLVATPAVDPAAVRRRLTEIAAAQLDANPAVHVYPYAPEHTAKAGRLRSPAPSASPARPRASRQPR